MTDPAKFCRLVYDDTLKIDLVDMVADHVLYLTYRSKRDFTVENDTSNIFISLWTTSMARVYLHKLMYAVATAPGCELLYTVSGVRRMVTLRDALGHRLADHRTPKRTRASSDGRLPRRPQ